jgi:hypothetical protein
MRRRKLRWVLAGLTVALVAVWAFVLWPRPDRVTQENFDRIAEGMSRAEVEAILGPPGDYSSGPLKTDGEGFYPMLPDGSGLVEDARNPVISWAAYGGEGERVEWRNDNHLIDVDFNADGVFRSKNHRDAARVDQWPLDNLLWRAKRQWRNWFPE